MLGLAVPVRALQSSTNDLSIVSGSFVGSMRAIIGLPPAGPGTVIQNLRKPGSQSGWSTPPAPLNVILPPTAFVRGWFRVAYGSTGQCAAGFVGVGQIFVGDSGALFATRTSRSFGSNPSSSARPHQWPVALPGFPGGMFVSHVAFAVFPYAMIFKSVGESGSTSATCTVLLPSPAHRRRFGVTRTPLGPGPFVVDVPPPLGFGPAMPPTRST